MTKWEPKFEIDYSPNGDDIDRAIQKTKAEFELIYVLLNALRQNFPMRNEPSDVLPFQVYFDVSGKKFIFATRKMTAGMFWAISTKIISVSRLKI